MDENEELAIGEPNAALFGEAVLLVFMAAILVMIVLAGNRDLTI